MHSVCHVPHPPPPFKHAANNHSLYVAHCKAKVPAAMQMVLAFGLHDYIFIMEDFNSGGELMPGCAVKNLFTEAGPFIGKKKCPQCHPFYIHSHISEQVELQWNTFWCRNRYPYRLFFFFISVFQKGQGEATRPGFY